ncbi:MAG: amidohydrolase [Kiritimatiellae bacterium]|nr:amidohydrolase [Kiritimatiellia bacterium]
MIIDSHVHLKHGGAGAVEYSPEEIVRVMDAAGIDKSVVFAMSTTTAHSIEMAEAAVRTFPDRLVPYVYALPRYDRPVLTELEDALANRGFRGIKIHQGQCSLQDYIVGPVFELAAARGVPCLIDFAGQSGLAEELATRYPAARIIIAHIGKYLCTDDRLLDQFIAIAENHENVRLDVSGVVRLWKIEDAVRRIGAGRLIWGTDGPHPAPDTVRFARRELDNIRNLDLDADAKAKLLGGSIRDLLDL